MKPFTEQKPVSEPLTGTVLTSRGAALAQADAFQHQAEDADVQQQTILEASQSGGRYSAALADQLEAKQDQVERLEGRLEGVIEQQEAKLHQIEAKQPGFLSLPGTRAGWQDQVQQQQALLQRLQGRLEGVREIRDGMGLHGPRIEELAARKLRQAEPDLADEWDKMRAAQRGHESLMRKKEQEKRLAAEREHSPTVARGQGQSLSLNRTVGP
ncbi:IncP plasmid survival protein KfrC family protein [Pseudomonas sp. AK106]